MLLSLSLTVKLASSRVFSLRLHIYLLAAALLQVPWLGGYNLVVRDTADNCLETTVHFFCAGRCLKLVKSFGGIVSITSEGEKRDTQADQHL